MKSAPLLFSTTARVAKSWIDYNGHMGVSYYTMLFDRCAEAFYEELGLGKTSAEGGGGSLFSLEHHTTFLKELLAGTPLVITLQLLDWDEKRIHYFLRMVNRDTGVTAATSEQLAIHVDTASRVSAPLPERVRDKIAALWPDHERIAQPREAGHIIRIRRKKVPGR